MLVPCVQVRCCILDEGMEFPPQNVSHPHNQFLLETDVNVYTSWNWSLSHDGVGHVARPVGQRNMKNKKQRNVKKHKAAWSVINNKPNWISLPFHKLLLESESHGRRLSGLLRDSVIEPTLICGTCKPSGRLKNVVPSHPTAPGTSCAIITGTNYDALCLKVNIYRDKYL